MPLVTFHAAPACPAIRRRRGGALRRPGTRLDQGVPRQQPGPRSPDLTAAPSATRLQAGRGGVSLRNRHDERPAAGAEAARGAERAGPTSKSRRGVDAFLVESLGPLWAISIPEIWHQLQSDNACDKKYLLRVRP